MQFELSALISNPNKIVPEDLKKTFAYLKQSEFSSGDLMADVMKGSPLTIIKLLAMDLDLSGCLANCSNKGSCSYSDISLLSCECEQFFTGSDCGTDIRACSKTPCKNNGTCNEIFRDDQPNTFTCNCSSDIFFGNW